MHLGLFKLLSSLLDDVHGKLVDNLAVLPELPVVWTAVVDQVKELVESAVDEMDDFSRILLEMACYNSHSILFTVRSLSA